MRPDISVKRERNFVLWRAKPAPPPELIIGQLDLGAPVAFVREQRFALRQAPGFPDLWLMPAASGNLVDGQVYHYWFEVTDSHPLRSGKRIRVTDPMAFTVDWRLLAAQPEGPGYGDDDRYPASVVKFSQGLLVPCDAGGETGALQNEPPRTNRPPNNRLVIYELPTAWTRMGTAGRTRDRHRNLSRRYFVD